jgi:histidinol dehydrogenase
MSFRIDKPLDRLTADDERVLLDRSTSADDTVRERTAAILRRVRAEGDAALRAMAAEFDGTDLDELEVGRLARRRALDRLDRDLRRALERAARNVAAAHRAFLPDSVEIETEPGIVVGRRPDPLARVGVYAPGGRAAYPSSVLMGVVPAKVARVGEVIVCSPPARDTGAPSDVVLAAAELAGADRVFALGGAGAIAAMAYGTASVPAVNRIVGPGNAYVAEAKVQVAGMVPIDSPAGPSELLVVCDAGADPRVVAREVLAQAEHDPDAAVVVVATSRRVADAVRAQLVAMLASAPRGEILRASLGQRGGLVWVDGDAEAPVDAGAIPAFANRWAAEHLLLAVREPREALDAYTGAGTVFLGETSSVAFGDYMTGANHVLPTGRAALSWSGLSTLDFVRWTTYQRVTRDAAARLAPDVGTFADSEGLPNHAAAARQWMGENR